MSLLYFAAVGICVADVYGFLAVFVTALTFRHTHRDHDFQGEMHAITEQVERLAMMLLLILLGGALVGGLFANVTATDIGFAVVLLLIVRPLTGWLGLLGYRAHRSEKYTLAFFGISGVGSIYYLAYGINHLAVTGVERLWGILGLVILMSILLHGLTVTPIMRLLDRQHGRDPDDGGCAAGFARTGDLALSQPPFSMSINLQNQSFAIYRHSRLYELSRQIQRHALLCVAEGSAIPAAGVGSTGGDRS